MSPTTTSDRVLALAGRLGVVRPRDLAGQHLPRTALARLFAAGVLDRPARGAYVLAGADPTEHHDLARACKAGAARGRLPAVGPPVPPAHHPGPVRGLARDRPQGPGSPGLDHPPLRVVRFSGAGLTVGVDEHAVEGVRARVTGPARTVADCFAYRTTVGLDVALEALRDCLRQRRATVDEIYRAAQARRMANVMRPYLEALA